MQQMRFLVALLVFLPACIGVASIHEHTLDPTDSDEQVDTDQEHEDDDPDGDSSGGDTDGGDTGGSDPDGGDTHVVTPGDYDGFPVREPTHVACIGDSITAGFGAQTQSYIAVLTQLLGSSVTLGAFGHAGATMQSAGAWPTAPYIGLDEYDAATAFVENAGADAVVDVTIMLGTNDAATQNWPMGGAAPEQLANDYKAMIDHFANLSTHPVVYMVLPPAIYQDDPTMSDNLQNGIIPILRQVAAEKGVPLIDANTPTQGMPAWPDGLHPNDAGHRAIAEAIYAGLIVEE